MDNLQIYNAVREVPSEAQKEIKGGRLKGMTDINPMWRIKTLTEQFGMCGVGWKYEIADKRIVNGEKSEQVAFMDINLYVRVDDNWSDAIPGTGGSMFVASESKGLYTSDECFKMALTDALSVACKALGIGADVYWEKDSSKYDKQQESSKQQEKQVNRATVKAKFFLAGGEKATDEGFNEWEKAQLEKGYTYNQMDSWLTKKLTKGAS